MDRSLPDRSPNAARAGAQERPSGAGAGAQERPEIAFLWKNLLSGSAFFRPRALLIVAFVIVVVCRWLGSREALEPFAAGVFALAWIIVLFTVLLGAQVARNDLRNDLPNADILKTYPLRGWQIVLGQVLAPTFMLASVLWLALLAATLTVPDARLEALAEYKTLLALGLAILIPPFCCIQLLVMNGLTLLFPAWIQALANRNDRGLDMLGQRILFMAAQLIVFALAFVPALVVGAVVVLVTKWVLGAIIAAVLALTAVVAVLVFEIAALVAWLGNRFERFDLSTELRP